jgi:hypothetical protein
MILPRVVLANALHLQVGIQVGLQRLNVCVPWMNLCNHASGGVIGCSQGLLVAAARVDVVDNENIGRQLSRLYSS